jgi:hypothetical protein
VEKPTCEMEDHVHSSQCGHNDAKNGAQMLLKAVPQSSQGKEWELYRAPKAVVMMERSKGKNECKLRTYKEVKALSRLGECAIPILTQGTEEYGKDVAPSSNT